MTFELTSSEALELITNGRGREDLERLLVYNRPHDCTFNGTIKSFAGKEVMLTCKGDDLGSVYFIQVEKLEDCYRLEYWGDSFKRIPSDNRSYSQNRLGIDDYTGRQEQSLHDLWQKENEESKWNSYNRGLLLSLLGGREEFEDKYLTNRERRIVATIIQWLGTGCGRAFIEVAQRTENHKS